MGQEQQPEPHRGAEATVPCPSALDLVAFGEKLMKKWMQKLVEQLEIKLDNHDTQGDNPDPQHMSEDRATLLFMIDTLTQHLLDIENYPSRGTRSTLDEFSKEILQSSSPDRIEKTLFRFRQYFHSYRLAEYTYVQKTFDDFRSIIWDFVDQLSEDLTEERASDLEIRKSLSHLREAVEANSIESLKSESRSFIDRYTELQSRKDERMGTRLKNVRKSLDTVKKQLSDATSSLRLDHMTKAFNKKAFEEEAKNLWNMHTMYDKSASLICLDIDHFKKVNDTYGHDIGDYVIIECVKMLKECFSRELDIVARVGGEEFCVLLPDYHLEHAVKKAEIALEKIRHEVFVKGELKLQFTVSMGIAELQKGESVDQWIKRADMALYDSKSNGRNRYTVAPHFGKRSVA